MSEVIALHTVLSPGHELDYERVHETIPAEVAAALAEHGVRDWRIWRDGVDVFHLVEVDDYAAMRAGLRDLPANVEWQATVAPFFTRADDYGDAPDADPTIALMWSLARQLGGEHSGHSDSPPEFATDDDGER